MTAGEFRELLEEEIDEARENPRNPARIPILADIVQARAPDDALAKVQRRFRLLDHGPALLRQGKSDGKSVAAKTAGPKKPAKSKRKSGK
jgi:hypothetical protein